MFIMEIVFFLFPFLVCETMHEEVMVEEQIPKCEDQLETVCFTPPEGGEEVCNKQFRKQVCTLESVKKTKHVPNTSCRTMERPRTDCGPQHCPVIQAEPVCEEVMKMVSCV